MCQFCKQMNERRARHVDFWPPAARPAAAVAAAEVAPHAFSVELPKVAILVSTVVLGVTLGLTFLAEELYIADDMDAEPSDQTETSLSPQPPSRFPEPRIVLDAAALLNASRRPDKPQRTQSPFLCQRRVCKELGHAVASLVGRDGVKPCDDFAAFACGRWNGTDEQVLEMLESRATSALLHDQDSLAGRILRTCLEPGPDLFRALASVYLKLTGTQGWPYSEWPKESIHRLSSALGAIYRELRTENIFIVRTTNPEEVSLDWARLSSKLPRSYFRDLDTCFGELAWYLTGRERGKGSVPRVGLWLASEYTPKCNDLLTAQRAGFVRWKEVLQSAFLDKDLSKMAICYPTTRSNVPPAGDVMNYAVFRMLMALTPFLDPSQTRYNWSSVAYARSPSHWQKLAHDTACVRMIDHFEPRLLARSLFRKSYFGHHPRKLRALLLSLQDVFVDSVKMSISSSQLLSQLQNLSLDLAPAPLESSEPHNYDGKMPLVYAWLHNALRHPEAHGPGLLALEPRLEPNGRQIWVPAVAFINPALHPGDDTLRAFLLPRLGPRLLSLLHTKAVDLARESPGSADELVDSFDMLTACLRRRDAASGVSAADLYGLRWSLKLFRKEALRLVSDHRFEGAEHLSAVQLFFVLYAVNACGELRFGGHPRVNAAVRNLPQFAEAFGCKRGAPMNRDDKCL